MVKLIYSSTYDTVADVAMRIVQEQSVLVKSASTIFGCDYAALAPDADHVGLHVTALGAYERYGANRNGDGFEKAACRKYHDTFVKHGSVFRHHRNKDRRKALGSIKASAYNEAMDRIELFIHANKEKCADELTRLEKDGEVPFSMACTEPGDWCSICNNFRKNAEDPNQCEHIAHELGKLRDDGKVACMLNRDVTFFDISFVGRPADRIAWNLKVASLGLETSVKLAEDSGIWVPDQVAVTSKSGIAKMALLKRIGAFQDQYLGWSTKQACVRTPVDRYFYELRKAAGAELDDDAIEALRRASPRDAFSALAKAGTVLTVRDFFKYAMGPSLHEIEPYLAGAAAMVGPVIDNAIKAGECQKLCNDSTFDVDDDVFGHGVGADVYAKLAQAAIIGPARDERIIMATLGEKVVKLAVDIGTRIEFNTHETVVLAEKYAAYELSAVDAMLRLHKDTDLNSVAAVVAAQNLMT